MRKKNIAIAYGIISGITLMYLLSVALDSLGVDGKQWLYIFIFIYIGAFFIFSASPSQRKMLLRFHIDKKLPQRVARPKKKRNNASTKNAKASAANAKDSAANAAASAQSAAASAQSAAASAANAKDSAANAAASAAASADNARVSPKRGASAEKGKARRETKTATFAKSNPSPPPAVPATKRETVADRGTVPTFLTSGNQYFVTLNGASYLDAVIVYAEQRAWAVSEVDGELSFVVDGARKPVFVDDRKKFVTEPKETRENVAAWSFD